MDFFSTVPGYDEPAHGEGENETEGAAKVALCWNIELSTGKKTYTFLDTYLRKKGSHMRSYQLILIWLSKETIFYPLESCLK